MQSIGWVISSRICLSCTHPVLHKWVEIRVERLKRLMVSIPRHRMTSMQVEMEIPYTEASVKRMQKFSRIFHNLEGSHKMKVSITLYAPGLNITDLKFH